MAVQEAPILEGVDLGRYAEALKNPGLSDEARAAVIEEAASEVFATVRGVEDLVAGMGGQYGTSREAVQRLVTEELVPHGA